jgi:hypothetical protein
MKLMNWDGRQFSFEYNPKYKDDLCLLVFSSNPPSMCRVQKYHDSLIISILYTFPIRGSWLSNVTVKYLSHSRLHFLFNSHFSVLFSFFSVLVYICHLAMS